MTYQEFDTKFTKHLKMLSYERLLKMAIEICKKLLFDYQQFYEINKWGDPNKLLNAIQLIEKSKMEVVDKSKIAMLMVEVEKVAPDADDFAEANYPLNACSAIYYTLQFVLHREPECIYNVWMLLYDTIDARVQGDDDLTEEEIDKHPLMIETRRYLLQ